MRFRYENFDFGQHKFLVLLYMVLMVGTIVVWRYILGIVLNKSIIEMLQG